MKKLWRRYTRWKDWRRLNGLNWFQQILVLLGLKKCLHFDQFLDWRDGDA